MKKKVFKLSKNLQKALTFPLVLFVSIVVVASVAFFGKKYTVSLDEMPEQDEDPEVLGEDVDEPFSIINECAFEEAPLEPCEIKGDLSVERTLVMKYGDLISSIQPGQGSTGNMTAVDNGDIEGHLIGTVVNVRLVIVNNTPVVHIYANAPNVDTGLGLGHPQFFLFQANGTKIIDHAKHDTLPDNRDYYEEFPEVDASQYLSDGIYAEITFGEFGEGQNIIKTGICNSSGCEGETTPDGNPTQIPPSNPSEPDVNPTWLAEWAGTIKIENLPAFEYFATTEYPGTEQTDYGATPGAGKVRVTPGQVFDPEEGKWLYYDPSIPVSGYAKLKGEGGITARPQYDAGSAVLIAAMGDDSDYSWTFRVPRQFITETRSDVTDIVDAESTHASGFFDYIQDLIDKITAWFQNNFGGKLCTDSDFPIDELYPYNATSGYESLFENGQIAYDLNDIIQGSDLMFTLQDGDCERYEENPSECMITTGLSECNNCWVDPLDVTKIICDNIDYYTGQVIEGREAYLADCLKGKEIFVHHSIKGFNDFELSGAAYILETYWKKLQILSPRRICHTKNMGIEVDIEARFYDTNMNSLCTGETGHEECEPDPEYSCMGGVKKKMKAYFPYLGTMIFSSAAYLDLQQAAYDEEVEDLPDCIDGADEKGLCYCYDNQDEPDKREPDQIALYLYKIGALTTKQEIAMTGFTESQLKEKIGEPVPPDVDEDGDEDGGDDDPTTPPSEPETSTCPVGNATHVSQWDRGPTHSLCHIQPQRPVDIAGKKGSLVFAPTNGTVEQIIMPWNVGLSCRRTPDANGSYGHYDGGIVLRFKGDDGKLYNFSHLEFDSFDFSTNQGTISNKYVIGPGTKVEAAHPIARLYDGYFDIDPNYSQYQNADGSSNSACWNHSHIHFYIEGGNSIEFTQTACGFAYDPNLFSNYPSVEDGYCCLDLKCQATAPN